MKNMAVLSFQSNKLLMIKQIKNVRRYTKSWEELSGTVANGAASYIYELWGYMTSSIILFKARFNWHLAHSPVQFGNNRLCHDSVGIFQHIVGEMLHIFSLSKVHSSKKKCTIVHRR